MISSMKQFLAVVAVWLGLSGCGVLAPRADPSSFYYLSPLAEAALLADKTVTNVKANFSVGLGPIELPGYLDRQQIALRTSTNRLSYSETDRWAAPLAENFSRVLGQNISLLLDPAQLVQFPWQTNESPDYQVKIEVVQFEGNSNRETWLTARWSVLDRNKKILAAQRSQLNRPVGSLSTEDFVKSLSETLGDLSREIVKILLYLQTPNKT